MCLSANYAASGNNWHPLTGRPTIRVSDAQSVAGKRLGFSAQLLRNTPFKYGQLMEINADESTAEDSWTSCRVNDAEIGYGPWNQ